MTPHGAASTGVLIRGGTVVDGSGAPGRRADVAVSGDRIVAVGTPGAMREQEGVDASGLVVCPGFIDMHAHSDLAVLASDRHVAKAMQGVTLEVVGQDGLSYAPVRDEEMLTAVRRQIKGWNEDDGRPLEWRTVHEYLADVDRVARCNVAYLVPHGNTRIWVAGYEARPVTPAEQDRMVRLVGQGMDQGAVGLSFGLTYAPSQHATTAELLALAAAVAARDGYLSPHHRSYGFGALEAYAECVEIARAIGVRLHLTHANLNYPPNMGAAPLLLDLVDQARSDGIEVTLDSYPYTAGATYLASFLPKWVDISAPLAVQPPDVVARIRHELEVRGSDGAHGVPVDWSNIVLSGGEHPQVRAHVGQSIRQIAAGRGQAPFDTYWRILELDGANASCINHAGHEENIRVIMTAPYQAIGTDSILVGDRPHPRGWGTFPRFLGRYVREEGLVSMEEAVRKITSLPASILRLRDRGLIRPGYAADVVCFDPDTIIDRATYADPMRYPEGIVHVMVNGQWVIREGRPTGRRAGRVLRGAQQVGTRRRDT